MVRKFLLGLIAEVITLCMQLQLRLQSGNPAKLPAEAVDHGETEIRNMKIGDSGYTVPWGLRVAEDGRLFLWGTYTLDPTPFGTVQMKVERKIEGYVVRIPAKEKYRLHEPNSLPADIVPVFEAHVG